MKSDQKCVLNLFGDVGLDLILIKMCFGIILEKKEIGTY